MEQFIVTVLLGCIYMVAEYTVHGYYQTMIIQLEYINHFLIVIFQKYFLLCCRHYA